jgi:flagellar protein FliL
VLLGGGAAYFLIKKKAHVEEEGDEATTSEKAEKGEKTEKADKAHDAKAAPKRDPKIPPAYVPLEVFTVNLADREVERYAQIGITLELDDAKDAERLKVYMPAIRNNILMVLAHKSSQELLEREGKVKLAGEVQRAASRALGVDVKEPPEEGAAEEGKPKKKPKAKKVPEVVLPILAVHFSNFIVQ